MKSTAVSIKSLPTDALPLKVRVEVPRPRHVTQLISLNFNEMSFASLLLFSNLLCLATFFLFTMKIGKYIKRIKI